MHPKKEFLQYILIALGSLIMAFGVVAFLSPNHIATGGTAGLAIVLHEVLLLPIGILMALINLPLLAVSLKYLGKQFAFRTIICIFFIVVSVDLFSFFELPCLSKNLMLATLYGGVTIGAGLGLIFKGGASAGGGTILAKIIASNSTIKTSTVVFLLDTVVILSAAFVFHSIELALWSLIGIYVSSKLIDTILVGGQNQKIVHISSAKDLHQLSKIIHAQLGISGTIITGSDLGETEKKDIIFIMVDKNKLMVLKHIVKAFDSETKMIVMEASEIM
jgi:uncharacterized membrane-anchored protein YitT (DUF2179 family)